MHFSIMLNRQSNLHSITCIVILIIEQFFSICSMNKTGAKENDLEKNQAMLEKFDIEYLLKNNILIENYSLTNNYFFAKKY